MQSKLTADNLKHVLAVLTGVAMEVEGLIGASGAAGGFDAGQAERLTQLFGNLAATSIQVAHDALGREVTPDSILALLPVSTSLDAVN